MAGGKASCTCKCFRALCSYCSRVARTPIHSNMVWQAAGSSAAGTRLVVVEVKDERQRGGGREGAQEQQVLEAEGAGAVVVLHCARGRGTGGMRWGSAEERRAMGECR